MFLIQLVSDGNFNQCSTHQQLWEPRDFELIFRKYYYTDHCDRGETGRRYARRTCGAHAICVILTFELNVTHSVEEEEEEKEEGVRTHAGFSLHLHPTRAIHIFHTLASC